MKSSICKCKYLDYIEIINVLVLLNYIVKPTYVVTSVKSNLLMRSPLLSQNLLMWSPLLSQNLLMWSPLLSQTCSCGHLYEVKPTHVVTSVKSKPAHVVTSIKSNLLMWSPLLSQNLLMWSPLLSQTYSCGHLC
jgi:hypothetical protein